MPENELKENNLHSYHNFMFPFRFDCILEGGIKDRHKYYRTNKFDKRVRIDNDFIASLKKDAWIYEKYEPNLHYNEFSYFHDFTRDALFNTEEFEVKATSYYFSKKLSKKDTFTIEIKDEKTYTLNFIGLSLRIFDTGVAILSIELENRDENNSHIDDILKINDFGRRIYPQFLGDDLTQSTKNTFLPDSIMINLQDKEIKEDFYYKEIPKEIKISTYIMELLGANSFTVKKENIGRNLIQPSIDDRMFVICWYANNGIVNSLKNYKYIKSDKWYEFVFIDGNGKTVQSPRMQTKLIKEATYDRWMNASTLYGISRYSFVCMSASDFTLAHIKTMYFQMFTLLLAQRASILRFSDEVTALSDIDSNELETQTSSLYKNYIRFVNKLYFREITPQDQGLEIYNQARDILKIDDDIKDLDNEIEELHKYVSMLEDNNRSKEMDKLSKLGYIFLPATFVAGFFGMNVFDKDSVDIGNHIGLTVSIVIIVSAFIYGYRKGQK